MQQFKRTRHRLFIHFSVLRINKTVYLFHLCTKSPGTFFGKWWTAMWPHNKKVPMPIFRFHISTLILWLYIHAALFSRFEDHIYVFNLILSSGSILWGTLWLVSLWKVATCHYRHYADSSDGDRTGGRNPQIITIKRWKAASRSFLIGAPALGSEAWQWRDRWEMLLCRVFVAWWQHCWRTDSIPHPVTPRTNKYDPAQIGMTCRPLIYCLSAAAIPEETHTYYYSAARTPRAPPSSDCFAGGKKEKKKALIFCSPEGREKWASHFPISTCQAVPLPQSFRANQFANHSTWCRGGREKAATVCLCLAQTGEIAHLFTAAYSLSRRFYIVLLITSYAHIIIIIKTKCDLWPPFVFNQGLNMRLFIHFSHLTFIYLPDISAFFLLI